MGVIIDSSPNLVAIAARHAYADSRDACWHLRKMRGRVCGQRIRVSRDLRPVLATRKTAFATHRDATAESRIRFRETADKVSRDSQVGSRDDGRGVAKPNAGVARPDSGVTLPASRKQSGRRRCRKARGTARDRPPGAADSRGTAACRIQAPRDALQCGLPKCL